MAFGVGFLLLQLSGRESRWRQVVTWGGLVVALGLIVGGVALRSRIVTTSQDISVAGRIWALQAGWGMWLDHPVLGVGLGRFADVFREYAPPSRYYIERLVAHNSWMEILAETGLLGFIAWCGMAIVTAREWFTSSQEVCNNEGKVVRAFVGAGLFSLFVASLVLNVHFNKFLWLFVFLAFRIKAVFATSVGEMTESSRHSITTVVPRIRKGWSPSFWPWILGSAGLIGVLLILISLSPLPERFYLNYMATPTPTHVAMPPDTAAHTPTPPAVAETRSLPARTIELLFEFSEVVRPGEEERDLAVAFHAITFVDSDGEELGELIFGTPATNRLQEYGWYDNEDGWYEDESLVRESFQWAGGSAKRARMRLPVPAQTAGLLLDTRAVEEVRMDVTVDCQMAASLRVTNEWRERYVPLTELSTGE
jgi:hypothetical protein